jgi:hypothetical protein
MYYRGVLSPARAMLVHIPIAAPGFTLEIIQPYDSYPSFWDELLKQNNNFFHHFGVNVGPAFASIRTQLDKMGFLTVQIGQGYVDNDCDYCVKTYKMICSGWG